jgi:biopolymer transport protein ExbD
MLRLGPHQPRIAGAGVTVLAGVAVAVMVALQPPSPSALLSLALSRQADTLVTSALVVRLDHTGSFSIAGVAASPESIGERYAALPPASRVLVVKVDRAARVDDVTLSLAALRAVGIDRCAIDPR